MKSAEFWTIADRRRCSAAVAVERAFERQPGGVAIVGAMVLGFLWVARSMLMERDT